MADRFASMMGPDCTCCDDQGGEAGCDHPLIIGVLRFGDRSPIAGVPVTISTQVLDGQGNAHAGDALAMGQTGSDGYYRSPINPSDSVVLTISYGGTDWTFTGINSCSDPVFCACKSTYHVATAGGAGVTRIGVNVASVGTGGPISVVGADSGGPDFDITVASVAYCQGTDGSGTGGIGSAYLTAQSNSAGYQSICLTVPTQACDSDLDVDMTAERFDGCFALSPYTLDANNNRIGCCVGTCAGPPGLDGLTPRRVQIQFSGKSSPNGTVYGSDGGRWIDLYPQLTTGPLGDAVVSGWDSGCRPGNGNYYGNRYGQLNQMVDNSGLTGNPGDKDTSKVFVQSTRVVVGNCTPSNTGGKPTYSVAYLAFSNGSCDVSTGSLQGTRGYLATDSNASPNPPSPGAFCHPVDFTASVRSGGTFEIREVACGSDPYNGGGSPYGGGSAST